MKSAERKPTRDGHSNCTRSSAEGKPTEKPNLPNFCRHLVAIFWACRWLLWPVRRRSSRKNPIRGRVIECNYAMIASSPSTIRQAVAYLVHRLLDEDFLDDISGPVDRCKPQRVRAATASITRDRRADSNCAPAVVRSKHRVKPFQRCCVVTT